MNVVFTTSEHLTQIERIENSLQNLFAWNLKKIESAFLNKSVCLSAVVDNQVVGYLICPYVLDEAEIHIIGVKEIWQRRGVASELINKLMTELTNKTIKKVFLEVRESNEKAIHFYKKKGFKQIGIRKNYYKTAHNQKENALIFQKTL